jgi:hypothetical protein
MFTCGMLELPNDMLTDAIISIKRISILNIRFIGASLQKSTLPISIYISEYGAPYNETRDTVTIM